MAQLATDNFNRADSGTLGANWTRISPNNLFIASNTVRATTTTDDISAYTGFGAISTNQYSQCTYNGGNGAGVCVRCSNSANTFYVGFFGEGTTCYIFKVIAGTFTALSTVTGATPASGDTLYIEAQGTSIVTKENGTVRNSITNTAIDGSTVGGPYPGLHGYDTNVAIDNFAMGDFTASSTISITEPQTVGESVSRQLLVFPKVLTESLTISEVAVQIKLLLFPTILNEAVTVGESVSSMAPFVAMAIIEALALADSDVLAPLDTVVLGSLALMSVGT